MLKVELAGILKNLDRPAEAKKALRRARDRAFWNHRRFVNTGNYNRRPIPAASAGPVSARST